MNIWTSFLNVIQDVLLDLELEKMNKSVVLIQMQSRSVLRELTNSVLKDNGFDESNSEQFYQEFKLYTACSPYTFEGHAKIRQLMIKFDEYLKERYSEEIKSNEKIASKIKALNLNLVKCVNEDGTQNYEVFKESEKKQSCYQFTKYSQNTMDKAKDYVDKALCETCEKKHTCGSSETECFTYTKLTTAFINGYNCKCEELKKE